MASKLLIRTGNSLMNRLRLSSTLQNNWIWSSQSLSQGHGVDVTPMLFPSVSKHQTAHHLQQNDTESLRKLESEGIFFPFGLPSLRFFLPDGDTSSTQEPMLLFPKRTFQPSTIRRKRNHGFFARYLSLSFPACLSSKQPRVGGKLLLEGLQRADQE
ncbi:uncharacterized protein LOC111480019 isoform X1 [Cucurbita maxima]|uniref:Uncharacterized protein LOC111480019 isoform X1 n=1 Tax=Cucurbita maxima TaxID=3661 RepID=A0A6J1IS44_CUCMA|nr:uncharacterized protein LOC111480019 isoform X1 [Cucurbita maxima]